MSLPLSKLLVSVLRLRCPFCLKGKVFDGLFNTLRRCPECGYFFTRESGYFLGSVYFGYGATVLVALGAWPMLKYVIALESELLILGILVAIAGLFPIWFFRYSRMIWMAFDLFWNPPVREDFDSRGR